MERLSKKQRRKLALLFSAATVALTVFIFHHSLQIAEVSDQKSDAIVGWLDWLYTLIDQDTLTFIVRKTAHFCEYGLLGVLSGFGLVFTTGKEKSLVFAPVYCTIIAIIDEFYCQRITEGRSPEWRDVSIDCCGAILAATAIALLLFLVKKKSTSKKGESK